MRLSISRNAALAAAFCATAARVFLDLSLDCATIHSGIWISALLGVVPAFAWLWTMDGFQMDSLKNRAVRAVVALSLLAASVTDASMVLSSIIRSANYLAPDRLPETILVLPAALAVLWSLWRNGDAIGYGAMLWSRIFPALLLVVILLQVRHYRPEWLFPLLGYGWSDILHGSVRSASWFIPTTAVLFVCDDSKDNGKGQRESPSAGLLATAVVIAALMLILRLMMAPVDIQSEDWQHRLDALLTNGRAPLYLQLPMIALWFIGLMHLLVCECFAGAASLQRLIPGLDGRVCALVICLGCSFMAVSGVASIGGLFDVGGSLFAVGILLIVLKFINHLLLKRGERPC